MGRDYQPHAKGSTARGTRAQTCSHQVIVNFETSSSVVWTPRILKYNIKKIILSQMPSSILHHTGPVRGYLVFISPFSFETTGELVSTHDYLVCACLGLWLLLAFLLFAWGVWGSLTIGGQYISKACCLEVLWKFPRRIHCSGYWRKEHYKQLS